MKLRCVICGKGLKDISILKKFTLRNDYQNCNTNLKDGSYTKIDTEYFNCRVESVSFTCDCGDIVISANNEPDLIDFIRDSDSIRPEDLKKTQYSIIAVEK